MTLSLRALNRAMLARQMLLARTRAAVPDAVERLCGLQAQLPRPPYIGLWTRLEAFGRAELTDGAVARTLARGTLMRGTLHLVTARDFPWMRATIAQVLEAGMRTVLGPAAATIDLGRVVRDARRIVEERPCAFDEIRARLAETHPGVNDRAMGYVVRCLLPLVQVPSADEAWGWSGKAPFGSAERWLGAAAADADVPRLVRRYLAAFGPATPADFSAWSGLRGATAAFAPMRDELASLRDERGREMFDVADGPRPDADTLAPIRLLPEYDNLLLGHADRSRLVAEAYRQRLVSKNLIVPATFLVDGFVAGTWKVAVRRGTATLTLSPFARLTRPAQAGLREEGERLLAFTEPGARSRAIAFEAPG